MFPLLSCRQNRNRTRKLPRDAFASGDHPFAWRSASFYPSLTDRARTLRPHPMPGCYRVLSIGLQLVALVAPAAAQTAISLNTLIGAPGTNAATVAGGRNAVETTGVALSAALFTPTAPRSS